MNLESFLKAPGTLLDVRSPSEYAQGHIPGAVSFPLFSDDERAVVGTLYKQKGRSEALEAGLECVAPKIARFLDERARFDAVKIYCWRGGMRSQAMGTLLQGPTLEGGYKTFRRWVLSYFQKPRELVVLGGLTGSGKTEILHALEKRGESALDLERLASHRGSSYGGIGLPPQPTCEHFENRLASKLASLKGPIWIEDESRMIGRCKIPDALFEQMQRAPLMIIEPPKEERIARLVREYGHLDQEALGEATRRLEKRLGNVRMQKVLKSAPQEAIEEVLAYYDKSYGNQCREGKVVKGEGLTPEEWAKSLQERYTR